MVRKIVWTNTAISQLQEAFLDLFEQSKSITIASRVISEIQESTEVLVVNPEIYKIDSLKRNNKGNIRSYEKHTYRISYLIEDDLIYILRVRYARKEPLEF